ncbi:MAG: hypothetical protein KC544_09455 [Gemmatimonadetes bacterium]|nr:hypothetical protein [Gemmatimonadota bacterium]HPF61730.1 peptidase MA family metallohydrolase [Gemmatimonadales bacterium]HRX18419.1 peptidase MA family metallohydrolase [Gemmatimonadales bacterium]
MHEIILRPTEWLGLGEVTLTPLTLVLVPDAAGFAAWSRGRVPMWGAGMSVPSRRLVVIRADGGNPLQTLRHELAHMALHSRVPTRVPLWFSEGYAALASGEHGRLDALQLNLAVALGRIPSLRELDGALRGSAADAGPAYALAAAAVADIARRHPSGRLDPMLERLRAGDGFDEALLRSTGLDPLGFDEAWRRTMRRRYNLGIWLLTGGSWAVLALVLAALAAERRRRDAPRRAALDVGWTLPPPDDTGMTPDDDSMTTAPAAGDRLDHPASDR